jgi:hypothetical protein
MEQRLRSLGIRGAVVLNRSQKHVVVAEEPEVHTPSCHPHAASGAVHLNGSTLQTNKGLCKKLLGGPMLIATGSYWFVAESVHLGQFEATPLESSHNDSSACGAQVDGHIAAR